MEEENNDINISIPASVSLNFDPLEEALTAPSSSLVLDPVSSALQTALTDTNDGSDPILDSNLDFLSLFVNASTDNNISEPNSQTQTDSHSLMTLESVHNQPDLLSTPTIDNIKVSQVQTSSVMSHSSSSPKMSALTSVVAPMEVCTPIPQSMPQIMNAVSANITTISEEPMEVPHQLKTPVSVSAVSTSQCQLISNQLMNSSSSQTSLTTQSSSSQTGSIAASSTAASSSIAASKSHILKTPEGVEIPFDSPLSQMDLQLLSLLQTANLNAPNLSEFQQYIKTIIQNNLILQTIKTSLSSSLIASPSKPLSAASSITNVTPSVSQTVRKPVLAQVIGTGGPVKKPSVPQLLAKTPSSLRQGGSSTMGVTPLASTTSLPQTSSISEATVSTSSLGPVSLNIVPSSDPSETPTTTPLGKSFIISQSKVPSILRKQTPPTSQSPLLALSAKLSSGSHSPAEVVKPVELEPMDIDVGSVTPMELPSHLADHTYCIYNPTIASRSRSIPDRLITIPSERLSYAPEVPDSPKTLFKLLKVMPKKSSSTSTSRHRSSIKGNGTPLGRLQRKISSNSSKKRKSGYGKRSRTVDSGDESFGSGTPEVSDGENEDATRRRSQRNKGQRKRYVDDLNLSISDEEALEDIMQPPPKKTGYYSMLQEDEEESDYDESGSSSLSGKDRLTRHKKAIAINPTEGFRYSDIYMDAPAEEAHIIEKILSHRTRSAENEEEQEKYGDEVEEFFVKYKNYSYLHTEWATVEKILKGDKRFDGKVKRYKTKQASLGIFANIDDEPFNPDYTVADRILDIASQIEPSGEKVTHYLVKWKSLPYEDSTWELEEDVDREAITKFLNYMTVPPFEELQYVRRPAPNRFKPIKESFQYKGENKLRPYQLEGLNWLLFNWYTRQNCILADEMGLGKTVQSIVFLLEIINAGIRGPFLVIAPLSTISNWQREFETWSDLNVVIYHGSAYSRRMIQEYELYYRDNGGKIIMDAYRFNVIVTTYEVMLSDNSELQNILWRAVIIDEAHRLKNKNCKMLEGLKELHMEHRVLLTGTPLQNNVDELFSLLNFLEPSQFPSPQAFLQQFGDLKTEEQVEELKAVLKPMMLRRLKEDVEKSLAPKEETIVEVELTAIQKQYYRAILERNFNFLTKGTTVPNLLNTMMELRKCCNHPFLISGAEAKIVEDFQIRYPDKHISNSLIQASGKLVLVDKLLPKLREKGHKVLIFSQMVRCLDILEDYLRMNGYLYERIDGQVRGTLRQAAIDRFSKPEYDRFVFLLCTRAGGLGINLTAADTVIIYDSDWNPQNDIQAQARCHRIGQNKMVKVYRLITTNSYEREMFDRASLKLGLDRAVLQSMNTQQQASGPPQLSKTEIESLLKKGAYGSIMESDDAANQFCEEDIDQILERRTQVIQLESEGKGSTFSKASFATDGSTDIDIDDPDFWQKWAEKANLNLDQLAKKDTLVVDEPRVRRQVRRYGDEMLETIVDMDESHEEIMDILPSRGRKGWTKLECFKTEKALLVYGWGQWVDILDSGRFRKRQLSTRDVENIARTMLVYCLHHFSGDEKIKLYIHQLIDPSEVTEDSNMIDKAQRGMFSGFTEEDYLALMAKDADSLFQEESYMKHLRRHSTRILLRVRLLHIIRWHIMKPYMHLIMSGVHAKDLGLQPPKPEEEPPAPWWDSLCDLSLLVAIVKHGYEQFQLWRADPTLCFKDLVGEEAPQTKIKNKKKKASKTASKKSYVDPESEVEDEEDLEEELDIGIESDGGSSAPSTPQMTPSLRKTRASAAAAVMLGASPGFISPLRGGVFIWPSLAEINTRARRLVNAYLKQQRREELRLAQLVKEQERKVREAEVSRKREQKKAELAQKWSKREEQDFTRVISFFGIEYEQGSNHYDWTRFRQLANLGKKSDDRLTLYFHDFKEMCRRVIRKKRPKIGYSSILIEPVNEERAIKCLQRIDLLSAVRKELLPHPNFNDLIKLCQSSFEVPHWWLPGQHDRDLLIGVAKHGLYRTDFLLYNDPDLSFLESVPKSALFTPNYSLVDDNEGDGGSESEAEGEDEEGQKVKPSAPSNSTPVPLGWPKEKAIVIRISRIIYAFRNKTWPKPMEGLDIFNPTANLNDEESSPSPSPSPQKSDSSLDSDHGSDDDYIQEERQGMLDSVKSNLTLRIGKASADGPFTVTLGPNTGDQDNQLNNDETIGDRLVAIEESSGDNFQVQKQQGLKMTLKKGRFFPRSYNQPSLSATPEDLPTQMNVKIPLITLQFPSRKGLGRIPKKKQSTNQGDPDSSKSPRPKMLIVNPNQLTVNDLTGNERIGVVNKNTGDKLAINHSPTLKKLESWLLSHPDFFVEAAWTPLVIGWGGLKHQLPQQIISKDPSTTTTANESTTQKDKEVDNN